MSHVYACDSVCVKIEVILGVLIYSKALCEAQPEYGLVQCRYVAINLCTQWMKRKESEKIIRIKSHELLLYELAVYFPI